MGTHSRTGSCQAGSAGGFFAEHGYLPAPRLVQWMATLRCGLSCEHCLAVSHESGFDDMSLEAVKGLIDQVAQMGVSEFLVTGGEPLVREDLPEVIEYLGRRQVNWTLNTAAFPNAQLRAAIERHSPGFVAVSFDGPESVHDGFRGKVGAWNEAREAIRFFKSMPQTRVCAGTTVTARNYDYLEETFHLAVASGADQWGIHLLVPEGRAADRQDLFLNKAQLKWLIKFVARKRRYFHVTMADEIGYLGSLEPLVRDQPLRCGAGTTHCVVLPDGEVVPCTTLDRSSSAGNIHQRPLAEIWADGFADIRQWQPAGKCKACDYAVACRGGCWLQRKAGAQCFKSVWHVPDILKTAAGIAICLGTLAASDGTPAKAATPLEKDVSSVTGMVQAVTTAGDSYTYSVNLDEAIVNLYAEKAAGLEAYSLVTPPDPRSCSPAAAYFFNHFYEGTLPTDIRERCALVRSVLESEQISLSLAAMLWRAIAEPMFDAGIEQTYSADERQVIRETLMALKSKADFWRLIIFENYLDPFLIGGREISSISIISKGGPRPGTIERRCLSQDQNKERWGAGEDPDTWEAALAYFLSHSYAEQMDLPFRITSDGGLHLYSGDTSQYVMDIDTTVNPERYAIGPFDVVVPSVDLTLQFEIKGKLRFVPSYDYSKAVFLDDAATNTDDEITTTVSINLEADREYTYVEILNAVYEANRFRLGAIAASWMVEQPVSLWSGEVEVVIGIHQNGALLWPAIREAKETGAFDVYRSRPGAGVETVTLDSYSLYHVLLKDLDYWMF